MEWSVQRGPHTDEGGIGMGPGAVGETAHVI